MRILLWHVHGAWTTAFVHGPHEYVVPVLPDRGRDGVGIARTYDWPRDRVTELPPEALRDEHFDAVLLQRPHELEHLAEEWTGRRPGRDIPAVYVEHNAPQGRIADMRHPAADRDDLLLVHVTHFNSLFWDAGSTPTRVGVPPASQKSALKCVTWTSRRSSRPAAGCRISAIRPCGALCST